MRDDVVLAANFRLCSILALSALPVPVLWLLALLLYHLLVCTARL